MGSLACDFDLSWLHFAPWLATPVTRIEPRGGPRFDREAEVFQRPRLHTARFSYPRHEAWTVTPYYQFTRAPADTKLGILNSGATNGGALLMNYNFSRGFSLAFRPEYIASNGNAAAGLNLLGYGAGSSAFSFTVTPAYQKSGFFPRGDFGIVDARSFVKCDAFGVLGNNGTQARGVAEPGSMF